MKKRIENFILVIFYIISSICGGLFIGSVCYYYKLGWLLSWFIGTVSAIVISVMVLNYRIKQLAGEKP